MRVGQCAHVLRQGSVHLTEGNSIPLSLLQGLEFLTSGLLAIGLWTPVDGLLQSMLECRWMYAVGHFDSAYFQAALMALCLSLLGPGAWSIDAHLFGRRRIRIDQRP